MYQGLSVAWAERTHQDGWSNFPTARISSESVNRICVVANTPWASSESCWFVSCCWICFFVNVLKLDKRAILEALMGRWVYGVDELNRTVHGFTKVVEALNALRWNEADSVTRNTRMFRDGYTGKDYDCLIVSYKRWAINVPCCFARYGLGHPVKHIKLQRALDGSYFLADCKMFRNIIESRPIRQILLIVL